jgi:hypothetical protein
MNQHTVTIGTADWLLVSRNMRLSALVDSTTFSPSPSDTRPGSLADLVGSERVLRGTLEGLDQLDRGDYVRVSRNRQ